MVAFHAAQYRGFGGCVPAKFVFINMSWSCARQAGVPGSGSSAGSFNKAPVEAALMQLVTCYRGVHHRVVMDAPHAASLAVSTTRALAQQPYKARVRPPRRAPHALISNMSNCYSCERPLVESGCSGL